MSLIFASIPQKRLLQGITSTSSSFYVNNIFGFDGLTNVTPSDLGTQHFVCFRNDTGTVVEFMEIDPATISTGPITIVRRGLSFYGNLTTETTALKLDWPTNSIVMFGTDVPQIFQWLKEYIDNASIAGAVPASTSAAGVVKIPTQAQVDAGTASDGTYKYAPPPDLIRAKKYHDYIADAGSNDTYAITVVPAITAYSTGQEFTFKANTINTGACTLNVCGLGAKTIKKNYNMDLQNGDIVANQIVTVVYDGTNMQLKSPVATGNSIISMVADEDLSLGVPVGVSNLVTGLKVARAKRPFTTATISFTVNSNCERPGTVFAIGGDKFIFLNSDTGADTLYATVGSINTSTKAVTLGTSVAVTADETTPYYVGCKLDTDKFIVFYCEDASTTIVKYRVGTVSGTTITLGSAATYFTGGTAINSMVCDQIATDKAVAFFPCATVTDSRLVACTVASTTATAGTPKAIGTTIDDNPSFSAIKKIGTDKFILATDSGSAASNYCQVGTLSGTTITLGTETVFSTNDNFGSSTYSIKIVSPATDVVVIRHSVSNIGEVVVGTVSGTTPTFGTPVTAGQYDSGLCADTASSFIVTNSTSAYADKYTFSGTTITSLGKALYYFEDIGNMINLDNGYFIAVYTTGTTIKVYIQGMSNNFLGVAQASISKGATIEVLIKGVDSNQSGLIPGGYYGITSGAFDTALSSSELSVGQINDKYALALSATQIQI